MVGAEGLGEVGLGSMGLFFFWKVRMVVGCWLLVVFLGLRF